MLWLTDTKIVWIGLQAQRALVDTLQHDSIKIGNFKVSNAQP